MKEININELTIGQAREIAALLQLQSTAAREDDNSHWEIGKPYLIRTVTMIDTGIVTKVTDKEIVLTNAAWISDTGRFSEAVSKAEFEEVEPFPEGNVIIGRGAIIDAVRITKSPRSVK